MKIAILAGGGGTRLWPLSRESSPKQFNKVLSDKTMLEDTIDRFSADYKPEDIFICLNRELLPRAKEILPDFPESNYIVEPEKRDTAPAMGFIAAFLFDKFPDEAIAYVPADHYINDEKKFLKILKFAENIIQETGKMVDIAIIPTFPSTVLGYTRIGDKFSETSGIDLYNFLSHTEKPNFEKAKEYLADGSYLWHASYYMWTPRKILEAFARYSPSHYQHLSQIIEHLKTGNEELVRESFKEMDKISFDYAITEKIDPADVLIIKGDFGWSDVGAFDVLYEAQKSKVDANNNVIIGDWVGVDTDNCLIYNKSKDLIATVGINDLLVVKVDDVILICSKSKAQEVKNIVQKIQKENKHQYL